MTEIHEPQKDHDLLIEINTVLKQVVRDIQDLKDGTSVKISDHEKRIESLERWKSSVTVMFSLSGIVGGFLAVLLIYHLMGK